MKKTKDQIVDAALIDFLEQLYLADVLQREISSLTWPRAKQIAQKILEELGQSGIRQ